MVLVTCQGDLRLDIQTMLTSVSFGPSETQTLKTVREACGEEISQEATHNNRTNMVDEMAFHLLEQDEIYGTVLEEIKGSGDDAHKEPTGGSGDQDQVLDAQNQIGGLRAYSESV